MPFLLLLIALAQSFHNKLQTILKTVLRPLAPYILLVGMFLAEKLARMFNFLKAKVLPPILLLGVVLVDLFYMLLGLLRGNETFVPADPILNQARAQK